MKQYIDYNTEICLNGLRIPKDPSNGDYKLFLEEQQNSEAELIPYIPQVVLPTWNDIITKRNQLLRESDSKVLPDANPETKKAWTAYREILIFITQIFSTPESVVWPLPPEL